MATSSAEDITRDEDVQGCATPAMAAGYGYLDDLSAISTGYWRACEHHR